MVAGVKYHIATHTAGQASGYGKSDTRSLVELVKLHKLFEYAFGLFGGHAYTVVFYSQLYGFGFGLNT